MVKSNKQLALSALSLVTSGGANAIILSGLGYAAYEVTLLTASLLCAVVCLMLHLGRRAPASLVIVAATGIFMVAYIAQALIYLSVSRNQAADLGDAISIRAIFSNAALGASSREIYSSLYIVLIGFAGLLVSAIYIRWVETASARGCGRKDLVISNPVTLAYAAIACTVFFGLIRKSLGLDSPIPSTNLPFGMGGLINITSSYVGPNLSLAAAFFAMHLGDLKKARTVALCAVLIGVFNYFLFTSKLSLIFPILFLLICQYLLNVRILAFRSVMMYLVAFVLIYPFLNLYRSALALGVSMGDMIEVVSQMYASQGQASDLNQSSIQVGISAILGRFVGYDPLMILIQANPYPYSLLEYLWDGNLDRFLTYEILDFQDPMGYSPGFLGRLFYISGSVGFVWIATCLTAGTLGVLVNKFWRGGVRLNFLSPLLLTYCLIFFSDGIRIELLRSLIISSLIIYLALKMIAKVRCVSDE